MDIILRRSLPKLREKLLEALQAVLPIVAIVLVFEAFVLLAEPPLYGLWTGLITLVIILYNFAGVWAMARVLLPRLLGRRGKALVAAVDGWLKPKKA